MTENLYGHRLTVLQANRLLTEPGWSLDENFTERLHTAFVPARRDGDQQRFLVYVSNSGQVIYLDRVLTRGKSCALFEQLADFERMLHTLEEGAKQPQRGRHVLYKLIPQGQDFPTHIPSLLADMPMVLKLSPERVAALDFTPGSLTLLEAPIRSIGRREAQQPPYFPVLLAYCGETVRRNVDGQWKMKLDRDGDTYEPWIITSALKEIFVGFSLWRSLEEDHPFSLARVGLDIDWNRPHNL